MSQDRQQSYPNSKSIEIVLDTKKYVEFKNGSLVCHLNQDTYQFAEHLLWSAILDDFVTKEKLNTWNAAICRSKKRNH